MTLPTFRQWLINELMIDFDTNMTPGQEVDQVRKMQVQAQQDPQKVVRDQLQNAEKEVTAASTSKSPTKNLDTSIARKKEELLRMQQQKLAQMGRKPNIQNQSLGSLGKPAQTY